MAARLNPWNQVRCPRCLGSFALLRRFCRCSQGCRTRLDAAGLARLPDSGKIEELSGILSALVFNPRYEPPRNLLARSLDWVRMRQVGYCPSCRNSSTCWICPECGSDLPPDGLGDRLGDTVLLGPAGSGKSTFLAVALTELERHGSRVGFLIDPSDESTRRRFRRRYTEPLYQTTPASLEATPAYLESQDSLRPLTFRVRSKVTEKTPDSRLSVFDTSGHDWEQRRDRLGESAPFLTRCNGLALVLDPTRLVPVREEIRRRAGRFHAVPGLDDRVDRRPIHLTDEIRSLGALLESAGGRLPFSGTLAVVLTKFDLWGEIADPGTVLATLAAGSAINIPFTEALEARVHEEIEALLVRWTGEAFLQQIELKFPKHRFFAVSALGAGAATSPASKPHPMRPWVMRPFLWLFGNQFCGVILPDEAHSEEA